MVLVVADHAQLHYRYLQVALLSARKAAPSLIPYLVFDGAPNEVTAWFERQGGRVILHELTISETLKRVCAAFFVCAFSLCPAVTRVDGVHHTCMDDDACMDDDTCMRCMCTCCQYRQWRQAISLPCGIATVGHFCGWMCRLSFPVPLQSTPTTQQWKRTFSSTLTTTCYL